MKSLSFRKDLVGVQDELLRFAYKLTTDREEAYRQLPVRLREGIYPLAMIFFCRSASCTCDCES